MLNFIILGMGYISARHLDAIKAVGGNLLAYHDVHDVVGHVDSRFINAKYYREFVHFDCFVDRQQRTLSKIDYAVILLPNHLHNPACRWAMNHGMDVIVEKPLVIHERNLDDLRDVEIRTGRKINTILQLRLHENAKQMVKNVDCLPKGSISEVVINYSTPRGPWFRDGSWKADVSKTGGIATAIGIHLFDLAGHAFGNWASAPYYLAELKKSCLKPNEKIYSDGFEIVSNTKDKIEGEMMFDKAEVLWSLSVEPGSKPNRVFSVNGKQYDFTNGFNDLHIESYRKIMAGEGFGIEDARQGIQITEAIRNVCK